MTWTDSPAFGAAFDVADGDLVVTIPPNNPRHISSPRVSVNFESGASVRARMVAFNTPGRFTVAFADQPTGVMGYVASFSTCGEGTIELFRGDRLGSIIFLGDGQVPWPYGPTEEYYIQLDVFDGVVSARVWRPGEPFPEPQISAPDATYTEGVASIAIQDFGSGECVATGDFEDAMAVVRFAQASSTPLVHSGRGDITADGRVTTDDLLVLLSTWGSCDGKCPPACPADIAPVGGDCTVGLADLLVLLSNWG